MRLRRVFLVPTLLACLAWIPSAQADWVSTISAANPLHWFRFEEATGATIADDQGSADVNGTYLGGVTLETPGLVGNAAAFNGSDGHVLVSGPNLAGDWTLETIFLADTANGGASQGVIGADFTATDRMGVKAEQWNETGQLGYTVFGVVDVTYADAAAATPADYSLITMVGTGAGVDLFVNGAFVESATTATPLSRFALGAGAVREDGTLIDALLGSIDELVIYDRALSADEISAHFSAIPEPSTAGLALLGILGTFACRRKR